VAGKRAKCPGCDQPIDVPAPVVEAGFQIVENPELVSDFEVIEDPSKPIAKVAPKPVARKSDPDLIEDFEVVDDEPKPQAKPATRKTTPEIVEDLEIVDEAPKKTVKPATILPAGPVAKSSGLSIQAKPVRRGEDDIPVVEAISNDEPRPKKRRRDEDDDDYEDDDDDYGPPLKKRRRSGPKDGTSMGEYGYAICYNCGADAAARVSYTFWGRIIGPAMICHVRCGRCGTTYNGRTGKSNDTAILIYILVSLGIGLALAAMGIIFAATR
jgi:hypothetical protein